MMDCTQFRRAILADPSLDSAEMRAHASSCQDCARYAGEVRGFEDRLGRALRVDPDGYGSAKRGLGGGDTVVPFRTREAARLPRAKLRARWLAAAASVLLALVVSGALWLAYPGPSLAADVVDHMAGEPDAWAVTQTPVPQIALDEVMQESHVRLKPEAGLVSYAHRCQFRGHQVPHLVVQTADGPVTVMLLTHEAAGKGVKFDEQGYRGVIVPMPGHGSLAVLERGASADQHAVERVASRVLAAIDWTA